MIKFTTKVRRGLGQMLRRNLRGNVERSIAHNTRLGLKRPERLTAAEADEIRLAVAWIEQEAAKLDEPSPAAAETTPEVGGGTAR